MSYYNPFFQPPNSGGEATDGQTAEDVAELIGTVNVSGNVYSVSSGLELARSAGQIFDYQSNVGTDPEDPNIVQISAESPVTATYRYRDGSGGWTSVASETEIDPTLYDDGDGGLATVSATDFTIHRIYLTLAGEDYIYYGQETFSSLADAIDGLNNDVVEDDTIGTAILRCQVIVRGNATDLSDAAQAEFRSVADGIGSGGGSGGSGGSGPADTDALAEGATNLYHTEARVNAASDVVANTTHRGRTDNPHGVTAAQVGADIAGSASGAILIHEATHPHSNIPSNDQRASLNNSPNAMTGGNPVATQADLVAGSIGFTADGDIAATDVQAAIEEVRDDTDTKLASKSDTSHTHSDATPSVSGFMSAADKTKLDDIDAGAEINPADTDALAEGSSNLYYTETRVSNNSAVVANTAKVSASGSVTDHSDVSSAGSGSIITADERSDIGVAIKTDEAGEIAGLTLKVTPVSGDILLIEDSADSNNKKRITVGSLSTGGGVTDHGALTGLGDDDHTQYHTDGRALTWLGTRSTSDLPEGSNEYYTDAKVAAAPAVAANTAKVSADGLVTTHSDVSSAGSGAIITAAERADIGVAIKTDEAGELAALTAKATPVSGDILLIEDSADSNNKKRITIGDLPTSGGASAIDDLSDVDTSTSAPTTGQVLEWNGTLWVPATPSGGGGTVTHRATWQGAFTLSASQAWTTFNTLYGQGFYQFNLNPGVNPPADSVNHMGFFVPGGASLTRVVLIGRSNNSDVADVDIYLRARDNDLTVATALNTTTLIGSRVILDTVGFSIAGTSTHHREAIIDIPSNVSTSGDEDISNDCWVVPYLRASTSIGAARSFYGELILEWT